MYVVGATCFKLNVLFYRLIYNEALFVWIVLLLFDRVQNELELFPTRLYGVPIIIDT